jgi:guanylate kinase
MRFVCATWPADRHRRTRCGTLKSRLPDAVTIFVLAPSRQILEHRLHARGEDADSVIERRLRDAPREIRNYYAYDYVVINQDPTLALFLRMSIWTRN